ncbi:uncharacterized protein LOC129983959 [Argiope bruennichi]|uniref:DDE Tnp4 domain-containing protein n=1 Tax=Argiope bruennichi TaxID=94029 RepID=A0A8T0EK70_ARGBR|nr:uncharacterized protein LOC129983959 [Argiope bruennichi]KAF8773126.1 hypothetical protein HNY73_015810 [Argiope bruennichi]
MAIADSKYRLVFVHIGKYGKDYDSIESNAKHLPDEKCLSGTESPEVPYFFVGDAAFGLHKHLLRPYARTHLTFEKRIFNYRLCRARRCIKCVFGILSNKWGIFHPPLNVQPQFAKDIVKACIILHNYVRDRDRYRTEDTMSVVGLKDIRAQSKQCEKHFM